jgi:hypothetical protein
MAAREMGGLSLADALVLCELLAKTDVARYERAALHWRSVSLTSGCLHSLGSRLLREPSPNSGTGGETWVSRR